MLPTRRSHKALISSNGFNFELTAIKIIGRVGNTSEVSEGINNNAKLLLYPHSLPADFQQQQGITTQNCRQPLKSVLTSLLWENSVTKTEQSCGALGGRPHRGKKHQWRRASTETIFSIFFFSNSTQRQKHWVFLLLILGDTKSMNQLLVYYLFCNLTAAWVLPSAAAKHYWSLWCCTNHLLLQHHQEILPTTFQ